MIVAHASQATGMAAWLLPILVTACLSLSALLVVQFRVVPRVEARKRREDRWEKDVLALGELLTIEYAECVSRYATELYKYLHIKESDKLTTERRSALLAENLMARREVRDELDRMRLRADWLVDRIRSIDEKGLVLIRFHMYSHGLKVNSVSNLDPSFADDLTVSELEGVAEKERASIAEIVAQLKEFAKGAVPHPPSRASQSWSSSRYRAKSLWKRFNPVAPRVDPG